MICLVIVVSARYENRTNLWEHELYSYLTTWQANYQADVTAV